MFVAAFKDWGNVLLHRQTATDKKQKVMLGYLWPVSEVFLFIWCYLPVANWFEIPVSIYLWLSPTSA